MNFIFKSFKLAPFFACLLCTMYSFGQTNEAFIEAPKPLIYDFVEEMPEFVGGKAALHKYLEANLKYPESAIENNIQGNCRIKFYVDESGNICEPYVYKGFDKDCDREALRVVKSMPKWKPGKNSGIKVKVRTTVVVTFKTE